MGNAATLTCQYDLEKAALYSVRWYFEAEEFYRFVPKESPPSIVFPVAGISVDEAESDMTRVTLRGVSRELSGRYQCEVSEDAPLFHTDIRALRMQVVELPKSDPTLQIDKPMISAVDSFRALCNVEPSYPAANITWSINGRRIHKTPFQRISYRTYETGTFSTLEMFPHSQLMQDIFKLFPQYLKSIGVLCEVSILHVYHKTVQQTVQLTHLSQTTVSPNSMGLDGSKRGGGGGGGGSGGVNSGGSGDPDNSPLTGSCAKKFNSFILLSLLFLLLLYNLSRADKL